MELDEWMWRNKVTARKLAKDLDVHYVYLGRIKNKQYTPSKKLAKLISDMTKGEVTVMELLYTAK